MRRELALLLTAAVATMLSIAVGDGGVVSAQSVGSWRNSSPGSSAPKYDSKGRLYWDANGQLVGRYNFHTKRYESINEPPPVIPAESTASSDRSTWPRPRYRERNATKPPLAIVFRGPGRSIGRSHIAGGQRGPKVIISGNYASGAIVRHQRAPVVEPSFVQAPSKKLTGVP